MDGVLDHWQGHVWSPHPLLLQAWLLIEHRVQEGEQDWLQGTNWAKTPRVPRG